MYKLMGTGTSAGRSTKIDQNWALERNMALHIVKKGESNTIVVQYKSSMCYLFLVL
jgi:hypothetical protein